MSERSATPMAPSDKPTEANNSAEREAQVAAITARVLRLRAQGKAATAEANASMTGDIMESWEAQARASIAAALIIRGAVEVPSIGGDGELPDEAGLRLRELTDYLFRLVTPELPERL